MLLWMLDTPLKRLNTLKMDCKSSSFSVYKFIRMFFSNRRGLPVDAIKFHLTPKEIDNKVDVKVIARQKETIQDVIDVVGEKTKQMKKQFHDLESPEVVTIIVDFPFLTLAPTLRRLGYQTYDQRDEEGGSQFKRGQVIDTLSNYMKNKLDDAEIQKCYILTDLKSTPQVSFAFS